MKYFILFFLLFGQNLTAAKSSKNDQPKVETKDEFAERAQAYYKTFGSNEGQISTDKDALAQKVRIREDFEQENIYNVVTPLKWLLTRDPQDFQSWYLLLTALVKQYVDGNTYDGTEAPELTAYLALKHAKTDEEKMLVLWQSAKWKPNHAGLKAAVKENANPAELQKKHDDILKHYPPVFKPYNISRPENPKLASACFEMTHPLPQNRLFDYKTFITISPAVADFSVQSSGKNICIDGLSYGQEYSLTLKKGLVAANTLTMDQDHTQPVFIDNRKPALAFREKGYVLPATGPQTLPLNTVNLAESYVELFKVPLRNLPNFANEGFLNAIYKYQITSMANEKLDPIWRGKMKTEGELNRASTHGIPLNAFVKKQLEPGVYLLTAQDQEREKYLNTNDLFSNQWFVVSDIGISAYQGLDGLHIFSRSLDTGKPVKTHLTLIAYNNKVLGDVDTDSDGHGLFNATQTRGKDGNRPRYVFAKIDEKDFSFLLLNETGFDLTDRGVTGRDPAKAFDAYLYSERGVYRPGEDVNLTGILRTKDLTYAGDQKLTLMIAAPDGKVVLSELIENQGAGGYSYLYELPTIAKQGEWHARLHIDPKADAITDCTFEVNDYVPPKIDVKIKAEGTAIQPDQDLVINLDAQYYYGRVGSNLTAKGRIDFKKSEHPFKGYETASFGFEEDTFLPLQSKLDEVTTDANGKATLRQTITTQSNVTYPLMLEVDAGVNEPAGRFVSKKISIPYFHKDYYVGIIPQFKDRQADDKANFKVLALTPEGQLKPITKVKYTLFEEEQNYAWYKSDGSSNVESTVTTKVISQGDLSLKAEGPVDLSLEVGFGRYRLEVIDPETGLGSSYRFARGWGLDSSPDRPDKLDLQLDQKAYNADDTIKLHLKSNFDGQLMLLATGSEALVPLKSTSINTQGDDISVSIPAEFEKAGGFYLIATAFKPMNTKTQSMTQRAMGVQWVSLKKGALGATVKLTHAPSIKSQSSLDVTLTYDQNLKKPYATIAVIDESLLNLTDYKSPDPLAYFMSQQKLAYQIFDLYGKLINPFGAILNDSLVGGDGAYGRAMSMLPANAHKTLSLFSGLIELTEGGTHKISFDIPDFTGKARIMAVVWDESKMASHSSTLLVKDDVVVDLALPRFLGTEDQASSVLSLTNTTASPKNLTLTVATEGPLSLGDLPTSVQLKSQEQLNFPLSLTAKSEEAVAKITLTLTDAEQHTRITHFQLSVQSPKAEHQHQSFGSLAPNAEMTITTEALAGFTPSLSKLSLSVGSTPQFNAKQLRSALMTYPYHCLEQTTSRAYATLLDPENTNRVKDLTDFASKIIGFQNFQGSFGIWGNDYSGDTFLTCYATELLTKIKKENLALPQASLELSLRYLRGLLQEKVTAQNVDNMAYTHYVLTLAGKNTIGQIRLFASNTSNIMKTSRLAHAFLGASFALLGDTATAFTLFNTAFSLPAANQSLYGSETRDLILTLVLLTETTQGYPTLMNHVQALTGKINAKSALTTQEQAWLLRLASFFEKQKNKFALNIGNEQKTSETAYQAEFNETDLAKGIKLKNTGDTPLYVTLTSHGKILPGGKFDRTTQPADSPYKIARTLYTMSGEPVTGPLTHGETYLVGLNVELNTKEAHHALLVDKLPACFEIESTGNKIPGAPDITVPQYQEKRDDRYLAAMLPGSDTSTYQLSYVVRVISTGQFSQPAPVIENMYQPTSYAMGTAGQITVNAGS